MAIRTIDALVFASSLMSAGAQTFSADELNRRMIERRAVEAVIRAMAPVNLDLMLQTARRMPRRLFCAGT